jgi:hypothetical protein
MNKNIRKGILAAALGIGIAAGAATTGKASASQYMAICTERAEHGSQEYGLTAWIGNRDEANQAGKDHEVRTHGHRWYVAER